MMVRKGVWDDSEDKGEDEKVDDFENEKEDKIRQFLG